MSVLKRRAFTLVELITVMGVIVLLVALIMPFLTGAVKAQRRVECAMHLEKIGQACATRIASMGMSMGTGFRGQVPPLGWQNALKSFVSNDKSVFICPEDGDPAPDHGGGLKGIYIEVWARGNFLTPLSNNTKS